MSERATKNTNKTTCKLPEHFQQTLSPEYSGSLLVFPLGPYPLPHAERGLQGQVSSLVLSALLSSRVWRKKREVPRVESASRQIAGKPQQLAHGRGETLPRLHALIKQAAPKIVEVWKWRRDSVSPRQRSGCWILPT